MKQMILPPASLQRQEVAYEVKLLEDCTLAQLRFETLESHRCNIASPKDEGETTRLETSFNFVSFVRSGLPRWLQVSGS